MNIFFAEASSGGLGALGLNVQSFVFQLITFVLVLVILRKFVYGKLVATLEARRQAVIDSLDDAKAAADSMEKTRAETAELLQQARAEAEGIIATAHKETTALIEAAETKAQTRADHIVATAEKRLAQDVEEAKKQLKAETLSLVRAATETVLTSKLDSTADTVLIERAVKQAEATK
jgi:F-type H+-transporting ATPase subunit b